MKDSFTPTTSSDESAAARGSDDVTLGDIEEQEMWEEHTRERVKQMQEASSAGWLHAAGSAELSAAQGHDKAAWMTSPVEADTADELIARFHEFAGCPQLRKSGGETCCASCLAELGWLALDLIPRLLPGDDYDA